VGIILKLLIVLILARMLVGVVRYLMRGPQPRKQANGQGPVRDASRRARKHLDGDIVDAEFEDITDKHKQG